MPITETLKRQRAGARKCLHATPLPNRSAGTCESVARTRISEVRPNGFRRDTTKEHPHSGGVRGKRHSRGGLNSPGASARVPTSTCTSLACPTASCGDLAKGSSYAHLRGAVQRPLPGHGPRASPLWGCAREKATGKQSAPLMQHCEPLIPSRGSPNQFGAPPRLFGATAASETESSASCTTGRETTLVPQSLSNPRWHCLGFGLASEMRIQR